MVEITKDWVRFEEEDPFNGNRVEGYISHHQGDDYGALYIQKVNDAKVQPQVILCTPKLRYPFDQNGKWHFPKAKRILCYEKLDGTNCFAFLYKDAKGQDFRSYKTRLTPFLRESRFGPFLSMWKEVLQQNPEIEKLIRFSPMNLSFELWGARNPHLVRYEAPGLTASLLFARDGQQVLPPAALRADAALCAPLRRAVERDYVWSYQQAQLELEGQLRQVEEGYLGVEGEVWYLLTEDGQWQLFKCKPETIEAIHWSQGGIGAAVVKATCLNAFESWDEPTVDQVKQLLREEFSEAEVEKVHSSVEKHLREAREQHEFRVRVLELYEGLGMNIVDQKREVMRALALHFKTGDMSRVYSVIMSKL